MTRDAMMMGLAPHHLATLASFLAGYAVILATPGPNMLVVGGVAALRGLRGAMPLCLGIAVGAGALCAVVLLTVGATSSVPGWENVGRLLGGVLLIYVAFNIARSSPPGEAASSRPAGRRAAFGAGFCTAATNPLTGAFFAAQFFSAFGTTTNLVLRAATVGGVVLLALGFFVGVAMLFAHPVAQHVARVWHRPIKWCATAGLALMAASMLRGNLGSY